MISANILYLGESNPASTAYHRRTALERLGHSVDHVPLSSFVPRSNRLLWKLHYLTGHQFRQSACEKALRKVVPRRQWDVIWVDSGWWCGPRVAEFLRERTSCLLLLNGDDPTGPREPHFWASLRRAVPFFNLCVAPRTESIVEFSELGAPAVMHFWRGYDEIAHDPQCSAIVPPDELRSQVAFIGTRMEDRHEFMIELLKRNVPLSLWGNGWKGRPGWQVLKTVWRGPSLSGPEFVAAMQRADICLGLLSKGNRDRYTRRSCEIPFVGGLFCAERTDEHLQMYRDGEEAMFWNDAQECAEVCHELLADPAKRAKIRAAGSRRIRELGVGNEEVCRKIMEQALQPNLDKGVVEIG